MIISDILTMPSRFDYKASVSFNSAFTSLLENVAHAGKLIRLDCSQLEYIDSAGLGLLVMSYKRAQSLHVKMSVFNVKKDVENIFRLANLQKIIDIT